MPTAYQYCTGPVFVYAAPTPNLGYVLTPPTPSTALYLGTCEQYPLVQGLQQWEPTYNDIAGLRPFDKQYFGTGKILVLDLNKFIQSNIDVICEGGVGTTFEVYWSRGNYKNLNGYAYTFWLSFGNFGSPVAIADMPAGEVYFNCNIQSVDYDPIGTRSRKTRLVVEAEPAYATNVSAISTVRGFGNYSLDSAFFSGLPTAL